MDHKTKSTSANGWGYLGGLEKSILKIKSKKPFKILIATQLLFICFVCSIFIFV